MNFRTDLLVLEIYLGVFQDFAHGKIVEDFVPAEWNLKSGDRLKYEACQFSGTAEVVDVIGEALRGKVKCTFRKVS